MEFCQKCGIVLVKKRTRYVCPKCKRAVKGKVKIKTSEKMAEKTKVGLLKEKESNVWPVTTATCQNPKCKNKKAYYWTAQKSTMDESEVRFFRCTKCKKTWREYA